MCDYTLGRKLRDNCHSNQRDKQFYSLDSSGLNKTVYNCDYAHKILKEKGEKVGFLFSP